MKSIIWLSTGENKEIERLLPCLNAKGIHNLSFHMQKLTTDYENVFQQLDQLILSAQQEKVSLVSFSWGAFLALSQLSLNPDHIDRVYIINPLIQNPKTSSQLWYQLTTLPLLGKVFSKDQEGQVYQRMAQEYPFSQELRSCPVPIRAFYTYQGFIKSHQTEFDYLQSLIHFSYFVGQSSSPQLNLADVEFIANDLSFFVLT